MMNNAASSLTEFILLCLLRGVEGAVTVSGSGGTGIPNQQALTLRCSYTVTSGDVVTSFAWRRLEGNSAVNIASGSVTPQTAIFRDSWQNKGVFVGDYTSSLDIELPASHVTSSYAGTYSCQVSGLSDTGRMDVTAAVLTGPSISSLPPTYTVIKSSRLRIDCSTYTTPGNPPTTSYNWTYDGSTASTGAVLDRRNISRSQGGSYNCTASNTQGSDSASVNVGVQYPPSIPGLPPVQNVTEFTNLKIDCSIYTTPGNPPTTSYNWTYDGSTASTGAVLDRRNISRSQGGNYTCTAGNSLTPSGGSQQQGTATAQVNVDVQYPPAIPGLPPVQNVTEFTNLKIDCTTYTTPGNPPTTSYTWTYDGSTASTGAVLDKRNISRSQGGSYTCTAGNTMTPSGGSQQQGTATAQVNVDVQYGPGSSVTITPSGPLERVEGSGPFTATCTAVCNPSCTITWRKDNSDLTSGQISLSNVSRTDQGDYTCQAQNGIGGPQQKSITLVVYYLATPHLTFNKSEVIENATVTVDCDVDSNPSVQMTVRNVGNNTVLVQRNTNTLNHTIQRAQCLHNGSYVCSADNRKTRTVHHTTMPLNVLCSPRHDFRKQRNGVVAQNKNSTASLTADIIANPLPNFTWYRYDGGSELPISNTTGITVTSTALQSVLQIYITSDADYGDYAVSVQNSVGQIMMVFTLTSETQPSKPTDVRVYSVGATSISLQWISSFNGGAEQTFTVQYKSESQWTTWKDDISDPGKGNQVTATLGGLTPARIYTLQVYGINEYGESGKVIIQESTLEAQEGNIAAVGGGVGAVVLVILIVVVVLFILRRRGVLKSRDESTQDVSRCHGSSKEEPEMQENDLYDFSDNKASGPEYAVVKKKITGVKKEDVYAKPEKKIKGNDAKENTKKTEKRKPKKDMKKERKPAKGRQNRGDVYENTMPGQSFVYANAGFECVEKEHNREGPNRRNEDGLLYVVIDFGNKQPSQEIHRAEKSTEYAAIAIGEVGPHLQPEENKAEK